MRRTIRNDGTDPAYLREAFGFIGPVNAAVQKARRAARTTESIVILARIVQYSDQVKKHVRSIRDEKDAAVAEERFNALKSEMQTLVDTAIRLKNQILEAESESAEPLPEVIDVDIAQRVLSKARSLNKDYVIHFPNKDIRVVNVHRFLGGGWLSTDEIDDFCISTLSTEHAFVRGAHYFTTVVAGNRSGNRSNDLPDLSVVSVIAFIIHDASIDTEQGNQHFIAAIIDIPRKRFIVHDGKGISDVDVYYTRMRDFYRRISVGTRHPLTSEWVNDRLFSATATKQDNDDDCGPIAVHVVESYVQQVQSEPVFSGDMSKYIRMHILQKLIVNVWGIPEFPIKATLITAPATEPDDDDVVEIDQNKQKTEVDAIATRVVRALEK